MPEDSNSLLALAHQLGHRGICNAEPAHPVVCLETRFGAADVLRPHGGFCQLPACEESHSGIVPMNHSNQDGPSLAESEEGRRLLKENTLPSDTYPTLSGIARVPRVGERAEERYARPLFIRDKNRMR